MRGGVLWGRRRMGPGHWRWFVADGSNVPPAYEVRRPSFPYLGVEFVASGEGVLRMGGKEHRLVAGVVFAYGPGVAHEITCVPERPLVKYFVDLAGRDADELLVTPRPGGIVQTSAPEQILRLFDDLLDAGMKKSAMTEKICAVIVQHLLLKIAETAVPLGETGAEAFETYQRCRSYIETNYQNVVDLPQIAAHGDIDPAYVCRLFKRFDRHGPWQYVVKLKMQDAAQRLKSPGAMIKTVSAELGFSDPFQFSRTFRRVYGVSPRRFLQLQRGAAVGV